MIKIPYSPHYQENRDRYGAATPCAVCGKAVTKVVYMVHIHNGGLDLVTDEEAATMDPGADLGFYPLGRDCLRKHPELKPYAYNILVPPADPQGAWIPVGDNGQGVRVTSSLDIKDDDEPALVAEREKVLGQVYALLLSLEPKSEEKPSE